MKLISAKYIYVDLWRLHVSEKQLLIIETQFQVNFYDKL